MTDEEVFVMMQKLEESESISPKDRDDSYVFAQIAMVETAIEDRFPASFWRRTKIGSSAGSVADQEGFS